MAERGEQFAAVAPGRAGGVFFGPGRGGALRQVDADRRQDTRFGIAFAKEIDPMLPRNPVGNGDISSPRYTRPSSIQTAYGGETAAGIRKI